MQRLRQHNLITYYCHKGKVKHVIQRVHDHHDAPSHHSEVAARLHSTQLTAQGHAEDEWRHHEAQEGVGEASHGAEHVAEVGCADGDGDVQQHQSRAQDVL